MTTYYVDGGKVAGGDGSQSTPFDSVLDITVGNNDVINLERGQSETIASQFNLNDGVTVQAFGSGDVYAITQSTNAASVIRVQEDVGCTVNDVKVLHSGTQTSAHGGIRTVGANGITCNRVTGSACFSSFKLSGTGEHYLYDCVSLDSIDDAVNATGTDYCEITGGYFIDAGSGLSNGDGISLSQVSNGCLISFCHIDNTTYAQKQCVLTSHASATGTHTVRDSVCDGGQNNLNFKVDTDCDRVKADSATDRGIQIDYQGTARTVSAVAVAASNVTSDGWVVFSTNNASGTHTAQVRQCTIHGPADVFGSCPSTSGVGAANVTVQNTIYSGSPTNRLTYSNTAPSYTSDYNCFSADGQFIGPVGGTAADLATFVSNESLETNSIVSDPLLFDPANGDLRISTASPCVRAGTQWWTTAPTGIDGVTF